MPFCLDDAPLAVGHIQHLPMRLLAWQPQKTSRGVLYGLEPSLPSRRHAQTAWDHIACLESSKDGAVPYKTAERRVI